MSNSQKANLNRVSQGIYDDFVASALNGYDVNEDYYLIKSYNLIIGLVDKKNKIYYEIGDRGPSVTTSKHRSLARYELRNLKHVQGPQIGHRVNSPMDVIQTYENQTRN